MFVDLITNKFKFKNIYCLLEDIEFRKDPLLFLL